MGNTIEIKNLYLPYVRKIVNLKLNIGLNYIEGRNGTGKTLLLDYISGIRQEKKQRYWEMTVLYTLIRVYFFLIVS